MTESHREALHALAKQHTQVPDEPGFIAARIIAMIINEAYYAKGEQISSEADIDIAMKLGTNYPLGPFEWARLIGLKKYMPCCLNYRLLIPVTHLHPHCHRRQPMHEPHFKHRYGTDRSQRQPGKEWAGKGSADT